MSEILRSDKLTPLHLRRTAVVYVRQSTPGQVENNKESTRLQYALADQARALGFTKVTVIDDDLGRSASGAVDRPGFDTLAGEVCTGEVGAIFCIEDSRLARNGREWHYLLDLCSMTGTLIIDPRGTYDPRLSNDRLMMGLKGSMAEFELSLFRQRSQAALLAKAKRGELRIPLPVGVCWTDDDKIELDPDLRVQSAIRTVFSKYTELGSVRQVLQWHRRGGVMVPTYSHDRHCRTPSWRLPSYQTIRGIITNPLYAGAYAFGRRETRTQLVDGHARKTEGHMKPRELWTVLIREHHPGYISWDCYERHQERLTENAHMHGQAGRKAGRGGRGLLAGVLRCRRCARMLSVVYKGASNAVPRYVCNLASRSSGVDVCISFGGLRPDEAVAAELLRTLDVHAITAALQAYDLLGKEGDGRAKALRLELEHVRYEAQLAARRYEVVDPAKRLVATELEARWNAALERVEELERALDVCVGQAASAPAIDRELLLSLAHDFTSVWNDPQADMRLKQRLVRILIQEIIADVDKASAEILLVIHWTGGRHSELRVPKNAPGHTARWTDPDAAKIIRAMAEAWSDRDIALTLNRLRWRTGTGLTWNEVRVRSIRHRMALPAFDPASHERTWLSLDQAATYLGVSTTAVRSLIKRKVLAATQVSPGAPWQLPREAVASPEVASALATQAGRPRGSRTPASDDRNPMIPGL